MGVIGNQIGVLHQYKGHLQDAFCNQSRTTPVVECFEPQVDQLSSLCVPNMQDIKTTFVKI